MKTPPAQGYGFMANKRRGQATLERENPYRNRFMPTSDSIIYDEAEAIRQIKALPREARLHLQHVFRNDLQTISACIELHQLEDARDIIFQIDCNLRRLNL